MFPLSYPEPMSEMSPRSVFVRSTRRVVLATGLMAVAAAAIGAQQYTTETRDPKQKQDEGFAKDYKAWLANPKHGSPLVDHLPLVAGIPTPKDIIGYHAGAPKKLTYYADQLKYYRALAKATPRVRVETIGKSDEGRELVVVWVSSDANMKNIAQNRANLAKIADPRGTSEDAIRELITKTKPHYHLMGGLHSGETGPSEMLMELVYRLATETSPIITQIRNNVYVSVTPVADADGRDRNVDWFYKGLEFAAANPTPAAAPGAPGAPGAAAAPFGGGGGGRGGAGGIGALPYWGKYVYHDNNRDINVDLMQMRAIIDWYFTAHPPIMHDLHEAQSLLYTYSGGPPQNPNLDPILFAELPFFANYELSQMTKWGMPGVYTHAFMDGWSPGYLGSVAYNHNGLMKMYETQSGRDVEAPAAAAAPAAPAAAAPAVGPTVANAAATAPVAVAAPGGGRGGRGGAGGGGGRGGAAAAAAPVGATVAGAPAPAPGAGFPGGGRGGAAAIPTGRGGGQDREWYRGIQFTQEDINTFTRRSNTNYMETGVLSSLQLTAMFPAMVLENFYIKTRNSIEEGKNKAPYGFVLPVQRDMTKVAEFVNILRIQRIEVGQATSAFKIGTTTYPAGSYVIKRDQPYGRLAKNLIEKQNYPDQRLNTYDDSGWSMGMAFNIDYAEIADSAILKVAVTAVEKVTLAGKTTGAGTAGIAIAHLGSNNMISLRYKLKNVPMQIAEKSFKVDSMEFPAGSFIVTDMAQAAAVRAAVQEFGLTAANLTAKPTVPTHDADLPRIAIFSTWGNTQNLGWYRLTFEQFGIPYDLIYKEQVKQGNLRAKYEVILMAEQNMSKQTVLAAPAAKPQPYKKSEKYQFLGMYGETDDMSGGIGQDGVDAIGAFLDAGGTLIAVGDAARLPIDFGWARSVDKAPIAGLTSQRPLVQGEIVRPEHPVFYGYSSTKMPVKYVGGSPLKVGVADEGNVLARYVGGDGAVLSGLMTGADSLRGKPFAVDIPQAYKGHGRVVLFSNNPIYRWQNHGEFNMIFNSVLNWNDEPKPDAPKIVP